MIRRFRLGNIEVDALTRASAMEAIGNLILAGGGNVFTPNADHVVLAEKNKRFASAYSRASLALPDGMPIVWASKLLGGALSERVTGSDLLLPLLRFTWEQDFSVFFLGSSDEVLRTVAQKIDDMCPRIRILGHASPMVSEAVTDEEVAAIMEPIRALQPDIIIVALGAPKQEIFIDKANTVAPQSVMLGLGASFDFLAGTAKRSPKWMQRIGCEWLWRLSQEPKRLWKRYLRDLLFPLVVIKQWRRNRTAHS